MQRTGLESISPLHPVFIAIRPGFLYKNQLLGRSPPDIVINPLVGCPQELCPVKALASYLSMSPDSRGSLFRNSSTERPLLPASIAKLICSIIGETNPNCLPRSHDVRKMATSLAWTRGLKVEEITSRAFWSSSTFIDYLFGAKDSELGCVALNSISS